MTLDIRDIIFKGLDNVVRVTAVLIANEPGIFAGVDRVKKILNDLELQYELLVKDGDEFKAGDWLLKVMGRPSSILKAEDLIIGAVAKSSGIATAARKAKEIVGDKIKVVSGGWKKMPIEIKDLIRQAELIGGVGIRILDSPFIYLDKNYIRIFGSIKEAIQHVSKLFNDRIIVVQIKGFTKPIEDEAVEAAIHGAGVIMIDTGNFDDIIKVSNTLHKVGLRNKVKIAFAGGLDFEKLRLLKEKNYDVDIVDVGRAILDAPLIDMRFDVISIEYLKEKERDKS
ncbi:MAG: hypothetical protein RXR10_00710 [Vulcanisaeta sp.]|jgi:nicotinate-nucleotide pyrophosphorylase (carboxylating)